VVNGGGAPRTGGKDVKVAYVRGMGGTGGGGVFIRVYGGDLRRRRLVVSCLRPGKLVEWVTRYNNHTKPTLDRVRQNLNLIVAVIN
jgi:hypothetical protein